MRRLIGCALLMASATGCATWRAERWSWDYETTVSVPSTIVLDETNPVQRLRLRIEVSEAARRLSAHQRAVRASVGVRGRWRLSGGELPQRAMLGEKVTFRGEGFLNSTTSLYDAATTSARLPLDSSIMVDVAGSGQQCTAETGPCTLIVVATFAWYGQRSGQIELAPEVWVELRGVGRSGRRTDPPQGAHARVLETELLPPVEGGKE